MTGSTTFGTLLSGNNVRSAASVDGMNIYASGANGIVYAPAGGSAVSINSTNTRDLEIAGGQLYYSTGSGTQGIYALGNGLPTAAGATGSLIAAVTNPYAFYFADLSSSVAGLDTLFVAVDTTTASTRAPRVNTDRPWIQLNGPIWRSSSASHSCPAFMRGR